MYMRLAFAVAAHLEPDILLVDEVLAVGDAEFQKKCLNKMREVASHGRTVLFVSHNLVAVENLCSRVIQLEAGRLVRDGAPAATIQGYLSEAAPATSVADLSQAGGRKGSGEIRFTHAEILDSDGALKPVVRAGDGFTIRLHYRCRAPVTRPVFSLAIVSQHNVPVFAIHTSDLNLTIPRVQHDGYLDLEIARANLMPGSYLVHLAVGDDVDVHRYDHVLDAFEIDLQPADVYGSGKLRAAGWSLVFLPCTWRVPA
jgi:lipopolysaccharide transport system ATP-binding protein